MRQAVVQPRPAVYRQVKTRTRGSDRSHKIDSWAIHKRILAKPNDHLTTTPTTRKTAHSLFAVSIPRGRIDRPTAQEPLSLNLGLTAGLMQ